MNTQSFISLLCLLLFSAVAWCGGKIGYVDMSVLINESPQILEANRKLTTEFGDQNDRIKRQQANLSALEKRIQQEGPLMTEDELSKLQERARIQERQVRRAKEDLQDEITIRNSQLVDEVQANLKQVVSQYAKENGYDAILINAILYANDEVDITDEVLAVLRSSYRAKN